MKEIKVKTERDRIRIARNLILSAGNQIGSVWFTKRTDGTKRRMAYRLHVSNPSYARTPTGKKTSKDSDNHLITVFDCNLVRYNKRSGKMNGRGDYRSIPLEGVYRVKVGGEVYRIKG